MFSLKCIFCGEFFNSKTRRGKICSAKCSYEKNNLRRRNNHLLNRKSKNCFTCGIMFLSRSDKNKYCSEKCQWKGKVLRKKNCKYPGCDRKSYLNKYCYAHNNMVNMGDDYFKMKITRPVGWTFKTGKGYVRIKNSDGKWINEHQAVMSKILGRDLTGKEEVHHINGDRGDNRPENLELWSNSHPSGQRVEDKVKWAREILIKYGSMYPG